MGRGSVLWLVAAVVAGCGSGAALVPDAASDGGSDIDVSITPPDAPRESVDVAPDGPPDAPPLTGRLVFDGVATLTAKPQDGGQFGTSLPPSHHFALAIDFDQRRMIVGGGGTAYAVPVTVGPGHTFHAEKVAPALQLFTVQLDGGLSCMRDEDVSYDSITFTVNGTSLTGTAEGHSNYLQYDYIIQTPFTAVIAGGPDATPPSVLISAPFGFSALLPVNPLSPPAFRISEPAAETSKARLVTSDNHAIDLVPSVNADADLSVVGFQSPDVVLRYGVKYHIDASGIVDLAGVHGAASDLTFETPATPPLVAEDGFEGVTTTTLSGASVIKTGSLPPITGTTSVYVSSVYGSPINQSGAPLTVRLPVQAGDTKVRFSYRIVAQNQGILGFSSVSATATVGVVDGKTSHGTQFVDGGHRTMLADVDAGTIYLGDVQTMEIPLPAGATNEVVFELSSSGFSCGPTSPTAGVLVDDLRVE